ncbi:hypothetical protein CCMA1212_008394 [Trichoderma ghanense]|uniref:Uncharacterized protein n=1 Tax=Trichoderma ghanense TaxID=65468 RepID=A0ABY2GWU1_9HYPO
MQSCRWISTLDILFSQAKSADTFIERTSASVLVVILLLAPTLSQFRQQSKHIVRLSKPISKLPHTTRVKGTW